MVDLPAICEVLNSSSSTTQEEQSIIFEMKYFLEFALNLLLKIKVRIVC